VIPRPRLFLDVDGTLFPYGATPHHQAAPEGNPLLGKLDPALGAWQTPTLVQYAAGRPFAWSNP
jgi:hypothetical protein